jgi:UDP-N-acetylglucosamine diphosphorylase/glucosamine-1-phosphate N-acetyltransferase
MSALYFYDDARARQFEPFALTRPASEMRAGTSLIRRRWEHATSLKSAGFISAPHLAHFEEGDAPPSVPPKTEIPAGSVVVNTRCVIPLGLEIDRFDLLMCDGQACAVRLAREVPAAQFADGSVDIGSIQTSLGGRKVQGRWMNEVWDYVATLPDQLMEDIPLRAKAMEAMEKTNATTVGEHGVFVEEGAVLGPQVVLDASAGPILIRRGAVIAPFTHLVGPIAVGRDSKILGDRVATSSIGDNCKVRGELSNTIFIGHGNKSHTGFVGHSYLGRWVNLGALTTTSNLKNTYGPVQLWTPSGVRATGQQFLGTLFGDHAKTGIGTMLTTGSVIGAGANVFGSHMLPRVVPPFAWGDGEPYETYDVAKFIAVAERVMSRRHVALGDEARKHLMEVHKRRWSI